MSEWSAVQNPMIQYAEQIGWQRVLPEDANVLRGGITEGFFADVLMVQLHALNPFLTSELAAEVVRRLRLLPATIEGNRDALKWLRGEMSVFVPAQNQERNVRLIDFETPDANRFHVTYEWKHKNAAHTNRADVVFMVNGIPVAIAELKAAGKSNGAAEGVEQIRRYHKESPEMMAVPQVFEVSEMLSFFYGATWSTSRKNLLNWKDDAPEALAYEAKVKGFFDRVRFLRMLKEYVLFLSKDDVLGKVILRQHQTRAVEKVVERVADPDKRRALIWHTQGSGKTLTMITIAGKLLRSTIKGEKPTVVMLIDRSELESQLFANIAAYGITNFKVAASKKDLQEILRSDYRGLVVSMIHKFDDIPANINTRHSIVILVDEAHRTTGGDLGNYLMGALPHASYIGFTGTPIDATAKGKGTFKTFGINDERGYLDKYSIRESIEDGTTVQLHYALAPSDLRVDRETLDKQFLSLTEAEGMTDQEELSAILERAVVLKEMMKAPTRVEKIAAFVAQHFRGTVAPMGFKAFLVAVDREACAFYKEALDKHLPPEMSRVVISAAHNDGAFLKRFYLDDAAEKEVRRDFIQADKQPQILIVTEKLLTGFDAPILYCLYLDKPMRDHVLLQTIARVNRPYEDAQGKAKPCGFVLDFVGIFERLEKALAFDSDEVSSVIQNIDVLKNLFLTMLQEQAPEYLPLAQGWTDKEKEKAIAYFEDKDTREKFYKFYKQLATLYDILSPDAFLRPYIRDYQNLSLLYALIRNAYANQIYVDKELTAKTRELLRERTIAADIALPNQIYTLGAAELAALKSGDENAATKILNLRKALAVKVEEESESKPFLLTIGERAEELAQAYEDRQITTQKVLDAFEQLAEEVIRSDAERQTLNLDENAFAIYAVLRPILLDVKPAQAEELNAVFAQFPDSAWNAEQQRHLRNALYKAVRPMVGATKMIDITDTLLRLRRV
ncbi:MAG: hsdR [Chthonomonadaceae bacterium]|nr:hsdR [Chthonomonadaceae bacterium]